jgi:hypothetical protein
MNKTYISLDDYNAYKERVFGDNHVWKTFEEREKMENTLNEMYKLLMPEVGMRATEILWSDRRAKTVVEVLTPNKIVVRENCTECLDYYNSDYKILDELSNMPAETFTRRKSGRWVAMGQTDKHGSVVLRLGERYHYIDPSF